MRIRRITAAAAAAAASLALAGLGGYVLHPEAISPAPCAVASSLTPSGDAILVDRHGSAWTFGSTVPGGVLEELVCTDGTWVKVTGYGN